MREIVTITLNPAFDIHYDAERFELGKENYSSRRTVDAGGKGVNISRSLLVNGMRSLAIIAMGEGDSAEFQAILDNEGVAYLPILCPGHIRHNVTIHPVGELETRLSQDSFQIDETVLQKLERMMTSVVKPGTLVAFAGRVPRGISLEALKEFFRVLKNQGALLILDSNSLSMEDLVEIRPWLIKPNEYEIAALLKRQLSTVDEIREAATEIHQLGIENVLISLGEQGLIYTGDQLQCHVRVPKIKPISTIGAGDSTLAGYMYGYVREFEQIEILKTAAAFGTSACLAEGTKPPQPEVVAQIKAEVTV